MRGSRGIFDHEGGTTDGLEHISGGGLLLERFLQVPGLRLKLLTSLCQLPIALSK
jgi:hypothetical protein